MRTTCSALLPISPLPVDFGHRELRRLNSAAVNSTRYVSIVKSSAQHSLARPTLRPSTMSAAPRQRRLSLESTGKGRALSSHRPQEIGRHIKLTCPFLRQLAGHARRVSKSLERRAWHTKLPRGLSVR